MFRWFEKWNINGDKGESKIFALKRIKYDKINSY